MEEEQGGGAGRAGGRRRRRGGRRRRKGRQPQAQPSASRLSLVASSSSSSFAPAPSDARWDTGRAPWYDAEGAAKAPLIIGVTGGTASGKTTVCRRVVELLGMPWVILLSMDRYYRGLSPAELEAADRGEYDFDHPDAFDWERMRKDLRALKEGRRVHVPVYDFATHSRRKESDTLYGGDVVIVEGIFTLHDARIRAMMDMMVFVDTDADLRLARRLRRDIAERGRTVESVLDQYEKTVKPSFDLWISPTKQYADLIIPRGGENHVAVNLLAEHVASTLRRRGVEFTAGAWLAADPSAARVSLPSTVRVLPDTPALRALHATVRAADAAPEDFKAGVDRLARLVVADALGWCVPHEPCEVRTPTGAAFAGARVPPGSVCAVSVVRGGDVLGEALGELMPDAVVGKIIIKQTDVKAHGPRLYYSKLPPGVAGTSVLLLDATLSTSNSARMAVHVLLDHGVAPERITLVCLLAAPEGLVTLTKAHPKIRIVTSFVEQGLDDRMFASPGLGAFGKRYFGE